jgi:hypothetical protein
MLHNFTHSKVNQSPEQPNLATNPATIAADPQPTATLDTASHNIFRISPLIRITLLSLYLALTIPLPFLARLTAPYLPSWLWVSGIGIGGVALYAALCERVVVDEETIQVTYPQWVPRFFRKGWSLPWAEIQALKPRSTGQGGIVYYFLSKSGQAFLLPMRVVGFAKLVQQVEAKTGIDTRDVRPLSQPWMYMILLGFTLFLLLMDGWTIWTAIVQGASTL